jgi:hypothetical protein
MESTHFNFTFEEHNVQYTAEVEVLLLESGNLKLGEYTVLAKDNHYVIMDIPEDVLDNEWQVWLSTQELA